MPDHEDFASYHIFFCPFIVDEPKRPSPVNYRGDCLEATGSLWRKRDQPSLDENPFPAADDFMAAQYFNQETRDLFLPQKKEESSCLRYRYDSEVVARTRYVIADGLEKNPCGRSYEYRLPVEKIELFLFHQRVGILQINVRNDQFPSLDDIQRIDDLGRRILLPFLPIRRDGTGIDRDGYILCADRLGLELDEDRRFVKSFREDAGNWTAQSDQDYYMPDFLYALLSGRFGDRTNDTGQANALKRSGIIQAVTDDRMYVCALVRSQELEGIAKEWDRAIEDDEKSRKIYAMAFADPGDATCQNSAMRKELLERAVYTRWSDYGTLYAVTGNAFLCMTSTSPAIIDSVIRPFWAEYYLIVALALAQKVSIMDFSQRAARTAGEGSSDFLTEDQVERIVRLHTSYVSWSNQEHLLEVTEQEQGMDLYRLLQEQLGIQPHIERLQEQLHGLFSAASASQGNRQNHRTETLTKVAGIWAICAIFVDILLNIPNGFNEVPDGIEKMRFLLPNPVSFFDILQLPGELTLWDIYSFRSPLTILLPFCALYIGYQAMKKNGITWESLWKRDDNP